jgi:hypothetical protein
MTMAPTEAAIPLVSKPDTSSPQLAKRESIHKRASDIVDDIAINPAGLPFITTLADQPTIKPIGSKNNKLAIDI